MRPSKVAMILKKLNDKFPTIHCLDREQDGTIIISAEHGSIDNAGLPLADYYAEYLTERTHEFGVSKELVSFLEGFHLFVEWENPGALIVCDA